MAIRPTGQVVAFAKLAGDLRSEQLVQNEIRLLHAIAAIDGSHSFAPAVLFEGRIGGWRTAVVSDVGGAVARPKFGDRERGLLRKLNQSGRRLVRDTAIFDRLTRAGDEVSLFNLADIADLSLPSPITHGDFAPWNLRVVGSALFAFDWEYGEIDGLPLIDAIHYHVQVGFLLLGWSPEQASAWIRRLASRHPLGLSTRHVYWLALMHSSLMRVRSLERGTSDGRHLDVRYVELSERLRRFVRN